MAGDTRPGGVLPQEVDEGHHHIDLAAVRPEWKLHGFDEFEFLVRAEIFRTIEARTAMLQDPELTLPYRVGRPLHRNLGHPFSGPFRRHVLAHIGADVAIAEVERIALDVGQNHVAR
jgi:hypothetical protein